VPKTARARRTIAKNRDVRGGPWYDAVMLYAVVDEDGTVEFLVRGTAEQAADDAAARGFDPVIDQTLASDNPVIQDVLDDQDEVSQLVAANPRKRGPMLAWERIMERRVNWASASQMTIEESWERLLPFFPRLTKDNISFYKVDDAVADTLATAQAGLGLVPEQRTAYKNRFVDRGWLTEDERLTPRGREVLDLYESDQLDEKVSKKGDRSYGVYQVSVRAGEHPKAWQTPTDMSKNLLGQNYKTKKDFPFGDVKVMGLSLTPATSWDRFGGKPIQPGIFKRTGRRLRINTCVGASKECIKACLVYSGRNEADPYNVLLKMAKTSAFFGETDAFGRMLYESCLRARGTGKQKAEGMVRLNVFSDIPWELVFPELFYELDDLQFYDYTKVIKREVPGNYHITFSYSGFNKRFCDQELERGRGIAAVFLNTETMKDDSAPEFSAEAAGLPRTFMGRPVVDGDISDVRPLDYEVAASVDAGPPPYVVGLKYKPPKKGDFDPKKSRFVVPVEEIDGRLVAAIVPRQQPDANPDADTAEDDVVIEQPDAVIGNPNYRAARRPKRRQNRTGKSSISEQLKRKLMR